MKKSIKKIVALLVTMGICSSFAFTVQADAYDHIGFDYMPSSYGIGTTQQLSLTAYDASGNAVTFSGSPTYSSSDERVITVSSTGLMTMANYGVATITAKYGNLTASMLVTVKQTIAISEAGEGSNSHDTTFCRTGSYSYKFSGGLNGNITDYAVTDYAKKNLIFNNSNIPANAVMEIWFYDNGQLEDSEAAVYMSAYQIDTSGTRAVGIINSSDTTYKVTGKGARRALSGANTWKSGSQVGICGDVTSTLIDTGIARTKGWHQVAFIRKNTNASAVVNDNGNKAQSNEYYAYLDGQLVHSETEVNRSFVMSFGYAGYNSNHNAYFADAGIYQYICVEGVTQSESSGTYTINYDNFYGKSGSQTIRYNWQVSDDGKTGWTDIPGATNLTTDSYTPNVAIYGDKYIRGGVKVIAGNIYPNYYYTLDGDYLWDGESYQSISLGKNTSYYTKGASNNQLNLVGYDKGKGEHSIASLSGATFTSSNESIATVTDAGVVTAVDYGVVTITATYGNLTASMLITVTNSSTEISEAGEGPGAHSTDKVRTGSYSYKFPGGTNAVGVMDYAYEYAKKNLIYVNTIPANAVMEVWFYDNGQLEDSEAAVYMSAYQIDTSGTRAVGIINSSDTTYKLTGKGARRALASANNWKPGSQVGICSEVTSTLIDTGIERTKGWHQVAFVRKNTDASATIADNGTRPKSTSYYTYLDGQLVDTETGKDRSFVMLFGYAGYNSNHNAYFADATIHQYIGVEDINLTESNSVFTLNHTYYGTTGTQTPSYKWQTSEDGVTGWTDIAGATSRTYAPTVNTRNKYVRGLVSVATSATTEYRNSESERPNFSLISATADSTQVNVSLRLVNDTGASIPYALVVGYFNSDESYLVAFDSLVSSVASGSNKTSHTFNIPTSVRGNYSKAKIFLWQNITNAQPYTQEILVQ